MLGFIIKKWAPYYTVKDSSYLFKRQGGTCAVYKKRLAANDSMHQRSVQCQTLMNPNSTKPDLTVITSTKVLGVKNSKMSNRETRCTTYVVRQILSPSRPKSLRTIKEVGICIVHGRQRALRLNPAP